MSTIELLNPLPMTLDRYEDDLAGILTRLGFSVERHLPLPIEAHSGASRSRRAANLVRFYSVRSSSIPMIIWPFLGYFDAWIWPLLRRHERLHLVVHDVPPLRPQIRSAIGTARFVGRLQPSTLNIIVHSHEAEHTLRSLGWRRIVTLPLPFVTPSASLREPQQWRQTGDRLRLTVAGQYKPSRTLNLLKELGGQQDNIELVLAGTGWPLIPGWQVLDRFLSEDDLDSLIRNSDAVLLPYERYSQSAMAVRALGLGTPVIGVEHPQLRDIYGHGYRGAVKSLSGPEVLSAFAEVCSISRTHLIKRAFEKQAEWDLSWSEYLNASRHKV